MNKSLYITAMNMVRDDCEKCPHNTKSGKCPSEAKHGRVGVLSTCAKAMYAHLLRKGVRATGEGKAPQAQAPFSE